MTKSENRIASFRPPATMTLCLLSSALTISPSILQPRKAASVRLAEAGCTPHEIAAITGHATLSELVRYTRAVDQRRLAEAAVAKTRTKTRKLSPRFAKKAKKR